MSIDTREIVLGILLDIEKNNVFSNIAISKALRNNQFSDKTLRAFITRLSEGTIEYKIQLDYILNQFSKTPVNKCKPLIRCVLRMSVYQIMYMNSVPNNAVCNEAVKLVKNHGMKNLSGFVNGVLRNICRSVKEIKLPENGDSKKQKVLYLSIKYSMPEWLCEFFLNNYKEDAEKIIAGSFEDRNLTIRVNTTLISRDELREILEQKNIKCENGNLDDKALIISGYDFIRKVPGYREGYFAVQDESSMMAVKMAGIKENDMVLDICAAPGGKTCYAAEELNGTGKVISRDLTEDKTQLIEENIERLKFNNVIVEKKDATELDTDLVDKIDVVIADLPCSGLGIIGKKNDIKYRISENQLNDLKQLQLRILDNAKRYVKNKGTLAYSTCTINPNENQNNIKEFLSSNSNFKVEYEKTFLQGIDNCDGFYICILKRVDEE